MSVKPLLAAPVFPGLDVASDPEIMRGVFADYLRPLRGGTYRVTDCRLSRVRYRRGTRCVLQYTLRLADSATGHERIQSVTGVMYTKDRTRRKWEKLQASYRREVPDDSLAFERFTFIPDLGMLVEVFPYDRRLPTLPLLAAGPPPELEPVLVGRFGPGDWRVEAWNTEPVRYLDRGVVLRYTARARDAGTGRRREKSFYAKVHRHKKGEQTYQALRALWRRTSANGEGFTVVRPLAYLSDLRALILEEAPGTPLDEILLGDGDTTGAVRRVARALAAFN